MPFDAILIQRKINFILNDLSRIKDVLKMSDEKHLSNDLKEALFERYLERTIGRMIAINYHILKELSDITPNDYFNSFIEMGKKKYLPHALSQNLAQSAGLRNRIAHEYDDIDEKKIFLAAQAAVKKVPEYLKYVIKVLDKHSKQKKLF